MNINLNTCSAVNFWCSQGVWCPLLKPSVNVCLIDSGDVVVGDAVVGGVVDGDEVGE